MLVIWLFGYLGISVVKDRCQKRIRSAKRSSSGKIRIQNGMPTGNRSHQTGCAMAIKGRWFRWVPRSYLLFKICTPVRSAQAGL